mgnify:CR=1 FL=1
MLWGRRYTVDPHVAAYTESETEKDSGTVTYEAWCLVDIGGYGRYNDIIIVIMGT